MDMDQQAITPKIGSLLRLPRDYIVARMLAEVNSKGFDVTSTELMVFMYPGPDGRRPIDLARQCYMTRQAMNYVLTGLENRGYLERSKESNTAARQVRMTDKGREMFEQIRSCIATIEQEWAAQLGIERFNALRDTLYDLSVLLGKFN